MPAARATFLEEATAEAQAARRWYAERSQTAADAFMEELDHAIARIEDFPEGWSPHIGGTRRYILRRFPFSIVYRLRGAETEVVAVAHHGRRPGYWKGRIRN
ncbi:MAG: type II toxin-antitoxin system RelE/ParE family toxin [Acidobacteria bacterium]|nr:type II toxin-antitoxin system RelE/ParE family toxin [Acidobacteriota bacterium]